MNISFGSAYYIKTGQDGVPQDVADNDTRCTVKAIVKDLEQKKVPAQGFFNPENNEGIICGFNQEKDLETVFDCIGLYPSKIGSRAINFTVEDPSDTSKFERIT